MTSVVCAVVLSSCTTDENPDGPTGPAPDDSSPRSLTVAPQIDTLWVGESEIFTATVYDAAGRTLPGTTVEWSSSDPNVLTISQQGTATGQAPGSVRVEAKTGTLSDSAEVVVRSRVATIEIVPPLHGMVVDDSLSIMALVRDQAGEILPDASVEWRSADPAVARIVGHDLLVALNPGMTTITATSEGISQSADLEVMTPPFTLVSAGRGHSCGRTEGGTAFCWGANDHGQLGDGTLEFSQVPRRVALQEPVRHISAGTGYSCAVTDSGRAYCWGDNKMRELGNTQVGHVSLVPAPVEGGHTYQSVSTSDMSHTCALAAGGGAICWGYNRFGQVGNGSTIDERTPVRVVDAGDFVAVAAGYMRTCGIAADGRVHCWGRGGHAQLGNPQSALEYCSGTHECATIPSPIAMTEPFTQVSAGAAHSCAISNSEAAYCWGWNAYGQLGIGSLDSTVTPTPVSGSHAFAVVSAARRHSCGVTTSGTAHCWGSGANGRLGTGTDADAIVPTAVAAPVVFASVTAGWSHSCGVTPDGVAHCWGDNMMGQLGDGTTEQRQAPIPVAHQLAVKTTPR